jgi:hypothetical protein
MDQELKRYLDAKFAKIDERFADVDRHADEMEKRLGALIARSMAGLGPWRCESPT